MRYPCLAVFIAGLLSSTISLLAQGHQPAPVKTDPTQPTAAPPKQGNEEPSAAGRGKIQFASSCGFCHGPDATGSRAPDLVRSAILSHDDHGNLISSVIRNGRPDKGMPAFTNLKDDQVSDIVAFLHQRAEQALNSADVPGDYPAAKLLTGSASAGKSYFEGTGGCTQCHSVSGDMAGIAKKFSPIDLQQKMVYPGGHGSVPTASVTLKDGTKYEGKLVVHNEFDIGLQCQDGWFRSWPQQEVAVEIHDPLSAHRELMNRYTDKDIHNLFAYLETLK